MIYFHKVVLYSLLSTEMNDKLMATLITSYAINTTTTFTEIIRQQHTQQHTFARTTVIIIVLIAHAFTNLNHRLMFQIAEFFLSGKIL